MHCGGAPAECAPTPSPIPPPWRSLVVYGGLKVGAKRLYMWPPGAASPTAHEAACVLDFYVAEAAQRGGIGAALFRAMLAAEGAAPAGLAYDRPSPKCLAFLARHFGLVQPTWHSTNFVTFPGFGEPAAPAATTASAAIWVSWGSCHCRHWPHAALACRPVSTQPHPPLPERHPLPLAPRACRPTWRRARSPHAASSMQRPPTHPAQPSPPVPPWPGRRRPCRALARAVQRTATPAAAAAAAAAPGPCTLMPPSSARRGPASRRSASGQPLPQARRSKRPGSCSRSGSRPGRSGPAVRACRPA